MIFPVPYYLIRNEIMTPQAIRHNKKQTETHTWVSYPAFDMVFSAQAGTDGGSLPIHRFIHCWLPQQNKNRIK